MVDKRKQEFGILTYQRQLINHFRVLAKCQRLLDRPQNKRQRRTELVGDIGEEIDLILRSLLKLSVGFFQFLLLGQDLIFLHFDLTRPFLHFLFQQFFLAAQVGDTHFIIIIDQQNDDHQYGNQEPFLFIERWCHLDIQLRNMVRPFSIGVRTFYPEGMIARRKVRITGKTAVRLHFHPIGIKTFQPVSIADLFRRHII